MGRKKILIIEDEVVIRSSLLKFLTKQGFKTSEAGSIDEAKSFDLDQFSLIITDLRLPGPIGTDIIQIAPRVPVLVMTSYASVDSAVDAMKLGAVDYIAKPFDYDDLLTTVNEIIENSAPEIVPIAGMLGNCEDMLVLFNRINKVAPTDTNVLIVGESGTGKELVAKALHQRSQQAGQEMISLNCAAIPDTLIESELFGHEKGAFTGATARRLGLVEAADGGTLFLDEIGELPLEAQARLLRVLQGGEVRRVGAVETLNVSVRLIAATHRNLKELTRQGAFREDLYYRLNVVKLILPPLRERGEDLLALAEHFLKLNCDKIGKPCLSFSDESSQLIQQYRWPGNIRELQNAIQRAVILCEHAIIPPDLLAIDMEGPGVNPDVESIPEDLSLEDYFLKFVLANQERMTETELAQKLGISRKTLYEKRQKLDVPRERSKKRGS
ncbi:MAG TPA: sigma-54 dependent transcriptional regulator [Pseudomonadales bacterium]|jgi:DNA-binding NtrC family response regulator|nr:response regulator [Gammaproteobacteria bacterium]MDP6027596.1 sigma-54 dependent transcriptional regulator [Pseudomonadales bacterium]MDP6317370.1 sigma-54 dependent transcriptional regulator [Pseudomonadales bacterium]MDP7313326.1 sigma-54 dependent transcriptional regulator [Pseudomonadales bacterium]HJP52749.1 sigma-54 dependent transcriptional regulator [Pseudomonadales bacterium]|tara:strand:- start:7546 stop:8868 length:1323 start_codon:yes stop_codon:yes gene_type:complete